tara:strand:- start:585 stop:1466 length:882 start_codon:yes stop_codon:yes gene_type:complete
MMHITLILPIFNDWQSLKILLKQIEIVVKETKYKFSVLLINDNSSLENNDQLNQNHFFKEVRIINLKKNVGSQKAIATGLKYISENTNEFGEKFIIMDSDGEDDPHKILDIISLLEKDNKQEVITLNRTLRKESFLFSILYELHLFFTFLLTFNYIRFGNYSFLNLNALKNISDQGDLWFAYSAAINKFFNNRSKIIAPRKKRISGKSKMSYLNLFKHSVYIHAVYKKNILYLYFFCTLIILVFSILNTFSMYFAIIISLFILHLSLIYFLINKEEISFNKCLDNIMSIKNLK